MFYFVNDIFKEEIPQSKLLKNIKVIIMSGGYGTRLKPLRKYS